MIRVDRSELVERSSDIVLLDLEATVDLAHGRAVPKLPSEMRSPVFCVLSDTVARISEKSCTEPTPEARERYAETLSFLGRGPALDGQQLVVLLRDEAVVRSSIRLTTQARDLVSKYELHVHQLVMIGAIRELDDLVRDDGTRVRTHVVAKYDSLAQLVVDLYEASLYVRVSAQAPRVQGGYRPGPFDALAAFGSTAPLSRTAGSERDRARGPLFDTNVMLDPNVHDSPDVRAAMERHSVVLLPHRVALELLVGSLPAAAGRRIPRGPARRSLREIQRRRFQGRDLHIAEEESAHDCRRQLELHARSAAEDFACPGLTDEQLIILGERLDAEVFTMDGAARTWCKEHFPLVQLRP